MNQLIIIRGAGNGELRTHVEGALYVIVDKTLDIT